MSDCGEPGWLAHEIVGDSETTQSLRRSLAQIAPFDTNVLISGETGVGKGLAARALHRLSPRRRDPFVHADCASLSSSLISSELFGHERGAFTGAIMRHAGRFERAARGTLFLDEIGELPLDLQGKLLRVLQDREFERVGGSESLPMTARVIAATSRDLHAETRAGRFRLDLFFRLCVIQIQIQPLRNRRVDVASLARLGLERIEGRLSLPRSRLSAEQIDRLARCDWYGNARELFNLLERLAIRCRGRSIQTADIDAAMAGTQIVPCERAAIVVCDSDAVSEPREHIARMLEATNGNVALAARRLGMARSTLRRRIAHHGMAARRSSSQTECADAFGESAEDEAQRDHREYASVEPYEGLLADVAQ